MNKALILFSGGKDSLLSTLLLIEKGFTVYLVTYENGCGLNSKSAIIMGKRLVKKYGEDKVKIVGIKNISPIWREFLNMYYNLKPSEILKNYGEVLISQFNCLSCRLSMYITSIIICIQMGINCVVDGARKSQLFAIEQDILLNKFTMLFKQYKIDILFPLKDLDDDFELKNQILIRGFVPKTYEPQCLIGMPITKEDNNKEIVESIARVYEKLLKETACKLIEKYKNVDIAGEYF